MIQLEITSPISLHMLKPDSRRALVAACRAALDAQGITRLERRIYRVEWVLYGPWLTAAGRPTENNTDNWTKPLADALAEAGGLGKRGRGDQFFDRDYSVRAVDSDVMRACITLF